MNEIEKIAAIEIECRSGDLTTIKEYLKAILSTVWEEGECFSGKRPFGNSGWKYDFYIPLIKGGFIDGEFDDNGYIKSCDSGKADELIYKVIDSF